MSGLAGRVIDALLRLDVDETVFAPDCITWHNFDQNEIPTVPDTFDAIRALRTVVPTYTMSDVVTHDAGDVSVAQFTIRATLPDGSEVSAPASLVVSARDGRAVRLQEYVDTAQVGALFGLLASVT